jgi:hypothetical protein
MRKIYPLSLLLCLISIGATAQNWSAFSSGRTYHYKSDTATSLPDQSIHFDSIEVTGLDSGFSVARRFVFPVDTSQRNQPMFCGREIKAAADGVFNFKNPMNLALPTQAGLGTTFTLDSISGLTAAVTRVYQSTVLGLTLDSVKVFTTLALDSLVLSKSYGILEWPASLGGSRFSLSGIQELGAGEVLPAFDGFMTMEEGADYYYESAYTEGDLIEQNSTFRVRFHVDTAQRVGNGLYVAWHGIVRETERIAGNVTGINVTQPSGNFLIEDRPNSVMTKSHTEQVRAPGTLQEFDFPMEWMTFRKSGSVDTSQNRWAGLWTTMTYEMNGTAKELHYGRSNGAVGWLYYGIGGDTCAASNIDQIRVVLREGNGVVHAEWADMFSSGTFDMVGSVVNGDTVGTVIDDGELLAAGESMTPTIAWSIAPNPAHDRVDVQWTDPKAGELQLLDLTGKVLQSQTLRGLGTTLDVQDLPAGMYLLTLTQGGARATKRLVIAD